MQDAAQGRLLSPEEKTGKLKSERQKRHYRQKKAKLQETENKTKLMKRSLNDSKAEKEQLSLMESALTKILETVDFMLDAFRSRYPKPPASAVVTKPDAGSRPAELAIMTATDASLTLAAVDEPSAEFMAYV